MENTDKPDTIKTFVCCALCGKNIDIDSLEIMRRLNVNEKNSVCTKCMEASELINQTTLGNITFF